MQHRIHQKPSARISERQASIVRELSRVAARPVVRKSVSADPAPPLGIDAEVFGEAIGGLIREVREELTERIESLEKQLRDRKGMTFCGEHQPALAYSPGAVVAKNARLYLAMTEQPAGSQLREGAHGWILMLKGVQP